MMMMMTWVWWNMYELTHCKCSSNEWIAKMKCYGIFTGYKIISSYFNVFKIFINHKESLVKTMMRFFEASKLVLVPIREEVLMKHDRSTLNYFIALQNLSWTNGILTTGYLNTLKNKISLAKYRISILFDVIIF